MARQTEAEQPGRLPYGCMSQSLAALIDAIGVPSLDIALAGAQTGLTICDEHGGWHWAVPKLEALPDTTLADLYENLRDAVGCQ